MKSEDLHHLIAKRESLKARIKAGDATYRMWPVERKELMQQLVAIGGVRPGEVRGQVTRGLQREIQAMAANGTSLGEIAQLLGYSRSTICLIKNDTYPSIVED